MRAREFSVRLRTAGQCAVLCVALGCGEDARSPAAGAPGGLLPPAAPGVGSVRAREPGILETTAISGSETSSTPLASDAGSGAAGAGSGGAAGRVASGQSSPNQASVAADSGEGASLQTACAGLQTDPGDGPWQPVAEQDVQRVCGLDPGSLARQDQRIDAPWAVVRHGRLCHSFRAIDMQPEEAFSTTKTLTAVVTGMVAYQTRNHPDRGRKSGPLRDTDRVDHWLDSFTYNPNAQIGHVLGMVAHNKDLSLGKREMVYDAFGTTQVGSLSDILNVAIAQAPNQLGGDLEQFTRRFLFGPLGMTQSTWSDGQPDKTIPYSWNTTVLDMARLGLLLLHDGVWNGQRLLDTDWVYKMTHPAFEDANTAWGYLTWLNAASNYHFNGVPGLVADYQGEQQVPRMPGSCAPVAIAKTHPHGLSDAADCRYRAPYTCDQSHDVGVWQAVGLFGQVIQGHPGLDLLIVGKFATGLTDLSGMSGSTALWDAVRPALLAATPDFNGDEAEFCLAYGRGNYAPDRP